MDINRIDEGNMDFLIQSYLSEKWRDVRLNLSSFTDGDDKDPIFPTYLANRIWVPDLVFDNTKSGSIFHLSQPNTNVKVMKNGWFSRYTRYNLLVGCRMHFQLYPMDTQRCFMKISTMSNADYKVLLHWAEEHTEASLTSIALTNDIQPLTYVLNPPETYKATEMWESGDFTYLYANFTFVRRLSGNVFNVYVPSILVVFLSWISFWLDITAVPARVTLGVTSLLTLATQVVQAKSGLPTISYMTAIDVWLFACLMTVFSSLLEFAIAYQLCTMEKKRAPKGVSHEMLIKSRDLIRISGSNLVEDSSKERSKDVASNTESCVTSQMKLDKICRRLFPFLFFTFFAAYWSYYLTKK